MILVLMAVLLAALLATVALLTDDRPRTLSGGRLARFGEPGGVPA